MFISNYESYFFPPKNETHSQIRAKYGSEKTKKFVYQLLLFLKEKELQFLNEFPWSELLKEETLKSVQECVICEISNKKKALFSDLVKICMKKAHDNRINVKGTKNYTSQKLSDPFLTVKRTELLYSIQRSYIILVACETIEAIRKSGIKFKLPPTEFFVDFFNQIFQDHKKELTKHSWYTDSFVICMTLIEAFVKTDIVVKEENIKDNSQRGKLRDNKIYWLKHSLSKTVPFSHHVPRIIPPKKITSLQNLKAVLSPYLKGELFLSPSKQTLQSLDLAQRKRFRINKTYLHLLDDLHNNEDQTTITELPFMSRKQLIDKNLEHRDWVEYSPKITPLQIYINKKAVTHLRSLETNKSKQKNLYLTSLSVADIKQIERDLNHKKRIISNEYSIGMAKRQLLQTSIVLARILIDYPIYYGTKTDFRLRMYPWEYLLSRTTGELKQLLCDFKELEITRDGLASLLSAYYNFSLDYCALWEIFLQNSSTKSRSFFSKAKAFFEEHNLVKNEHLFDCEEKITYVLTLHQILYGIFYENKKKISVFLEIDQVCSGITFMALLLKIKPLAEATNLVGTEPKDIYTLLMRQVREYLEKSDFHDETVIEFLTNSRKCMKGVLMRWGYSEGAKSREEKINTDFKDFYKRSPSNSEYATIAYFAKSFDAFMENFFPKISTQTRLLEKVLYIRVNSGQKNVSIRTLDGSTISWTVTPKTTVNKGYWNPATNTSSTLKINIPVAENTYRKAEKQAMSNLLRGFMPHLIHSIDAAIMRLTISRIWSKRKYVIGQLHDCFMVHPNHARIVHETLREIYTDGTLTDIANTLYFEPMKEGLNDDAKKQIEGIQKEFQDNADTFVLMPESFDIKNVYHWEGSVKRDLLFKRIEEKKNSASN